jgi:hypothetical protein
MIRTKTRRTASCTCATAAKRHLGDPWKKCNITRLVPSVVHPSNVHIMLYTCPQYPPLNL